MHETTVSEERARSLKFVQITFATIAALALGISLGMHLDILGLNLPADDASVISRAFLFVALVDTAMVFIWERLFGANA